jgi:hypothetical protein
MALESGATAAALPGEPNAIAAAADAALSDPIKISMSSAFTARLG